MPAIISAARLRAARQQAGLTREVVATETHRSYNTIVAYEKGSGIPSAPVLVRLSQLYGVPVEDFLEVQEVVA